MEFDPSPLSEALNRVDALRTEIDAMRPLDPDALGRATQRLRLEWTYHTNAIEGNSLDYGETRALLLHGVTAHGKPLKDHLDIRRHREVIDFLEGFVRTDDPLTLAVIRELHKLLMGETYEVEAETPDGKRFKRDERGGEFKTHPNHVRTATGEMHYYATPEETPARMGDLMDAYEGWREQVARGEMHPLVAAASLHHGFVEIHPFPDGNGRLARVLMNLLLMRAGFPPAVIRQEHRPAYYGALAEADAGHLTPFVAFVADELTVTMELYLRALRNEPDPEAFDRRLSLFRQEMNTLPKHMIPKSREMQSYIFDNFVNLILENIDVVISKLRDLFESGNSNLSIRTRSNDHKFNEATQDHISSGDWIELEKWCQLDRFIYDIHYSLYINATFKSEANMFKVSMIPSSDEFRQKEYKYDSLPDKREAEVIIKDMQSSILDFIEKVRPSQN